MISGYFMMISIAKAAGKEDSLGVSTVKFLRHKYVTLAQYLIPAVLIAVCAFVAAGITPLSEAVRNAPLLLFEIIPMNAFGFEGYYVVGISWYLSSMLFALAVLYPLCRRFGQDFVLIAFSVDNSKHNYSPGVFINQIIPNVILYQKPAYVFSF